ncbi:TraB/GumN family protein [Fertoebacter nigrum]|uniref:TraB/GumN family protein n=1 Tax=Fertoeibacter niger TaxID=2656921 RepID=A0A8X8GZZ9_9RHOB|nr:TraB/GumN family protein [Fertoeibacter niger]NUB44410.1 TraB/GumN family protein [Fertoeibacter niger]
MHRFVSALSALAALLFLALPAHAECKGANLIAALPPAERAELDAAVAAQPHASGNFWQATRRTAAGEERIWLIGTYHMDDPRHAATMAAVGPMLARARTLLVEAGPEEQAALKAALAKDPALMFVYDGPTLPERMAAAEWQAVTDAMRTRGVPPFLAAKFQPWYLSMLLGMPACAMDKMKAANGLDAQLIAQAAVQGLPVRALEPYDTVFSLFGSLTADQQLGMIRSALAMESQGADYAVTLADAYFAGESRQIWEFLRLASHKLPGATPAKAEAEFAMMEEAMMMARNRAWIPVIEAAAKDGPVLAAFGALHLPGKEGVLALLERQGYVVEALPLPSH